MPSRLHCGHVTSFVPSTPGDIRTQTLQQDLGKDSIKVETENVQAFLELVESR